MQTHSNDPDRNDPFGQFRRDHARVLAQADQLERQVLAATAAPDETLLGETVELLRRQFATHMTAEETVLYPAIQLAFPSGRSTLEALREDHIELRLMLATISRLLDASRSPERDEQVQVVLRDLVDLLRLHIHREESAVFDVASRVLSDNEAGELAKRIRALVDLNTLSGTEPGSTKGMNS